VALLRYTIAGVAREYDLTEKTIIGRSPECDLILSGTTVSRKHCSISRHANKFYIEDLGSRSGTLVNSQPVRKEPLRDADVITVGSFTLEFYEGRKRPHSRSKELRWAEILATSRPADLKIKRTISSPESISIGSITPLTREKTISKRLEDLWDITAQVTHLCTPEELCSLTLPRMLACLGGDRARVLLQYGETDEMKVVSAVSRTRAGGRSAFRFPSTLQELVVRRKRALLVQDALWDKRLKGSDSTAEQGIRSAIVAPLLDNQKCIGLIEADSTTERECYDDDDLKFLCIVAQLLSSSLLSCIRYSSLQTENVALKKLLDQESELVVGSAPCFRRLLEKAKQVAQSEAAILLLGESGTGKNLLAKAIRTWSPSNKGPFIEISCPTLPDTLLESELFGYEKGAFTGAFQSKKGRIEMAQGGTLFLDEIGDLSERMQGKLLQFLDSRALQRLGATTSSRVDVRVIASTNKDLPAEVEAGRFRTDLFHRLNVISLCLPALRDRKEDIPALATYFVAKLSEREGKPPVQISSQAMEILLSHDWPGNIRELENVVENAVILCNETSIRPKHILVGRRNMPGFAEHGGNYYDAVRDASRRIIETTLAESNGVQREAAKKLGLNETYLAKLIKKFGMKK